MTVYAIGDVQGCYDDLQSLIEKIHFDPARDTLWFAGDLVNRGKQSLETLRYVKSLGNSAITVLGNHDLHLLAVDAGFKKDKSGDLAEIMDAPDRRDLLDWLRSRPLLHHDETSGYTLIHAGLSPQWDLATAQRCSSELQSVLSDDDYHDFLAVMYGDEPRAWSESLTGWDRLRYICNCFTRIRFCNKQGELALDHKGSPDSTTDEFIPWFDVPDRKSASLNLVFGHWSTLGNHHQDGIYALDTGCVWGGKLTAMKLESHPPEYIQINCSGAQNPYDYI